MTVTIPLANGFTCRIDDEDEAFITQWKWRGHRSHHGRVDAARIQRVAGKRSIVLMHRLLLGLASVSDPKVDHIDGDTLNNCRSNLRTVTPAQNMQNRRGATRQSQTGVRGVCIDKRSGSYIAQVRVNGQGVLRKCFATLEEADQAVRQARATYMTHSSECRPDDCAAVAGALR